MSHFVRYVVAFSASILFTLPVIAQKDCSLPPSGLIPLTDFEGQSYRGFIGGLYPDGMNTPPLAHSAALQAARHRIFRRDASGTPSQNGAIVFIGVGASNPRTEFNRLMQISDTFALRNPALKLVNSCIGGQGIQKMNSPTDNYWKQAQKTLDSMGLNAKQVQVVWVETDNTQTADTLFPRAPQSLMDDFRALFTTLKDLYPNLQIIYCSARTYSGYIKLADATAGRGLLHPRDYYNGWSIKWMIERQMSGNAEWTATENGATMPVITWATYNWTDGNTPRKDGIQWDCATHFGGDGLHLTELGEWKSGKLMFDFFRTDSIASQWFTNRPGVADSTTSVSEETQLQTSIHLRSSFSLLTIRPQTDKDTPVSISTMYGSTLYEATISQPINIATDTWANGIYLLRNGTQSQLILKER